MRSRDTNPIPTMLAGYHTIRLLALSHGCVTGGILPVMGQLHKQPNRPIKPPTVQAVLNGEPGTRFHRGVEADYICSHLAVKTMGGLTIQMKCEIMNRTPPMNTVELAISNYDPIWWTLVIGWLAIELENYIDKFSPTKVNSIAKHILPLIIEYHYFHADDGELAIFLLIAHYSYGTLATSWNINYWLIDY